MSILIPVKDGKRNYPSQIKPIVREMPGHFAIEEKERLMSRVPYSLHTEDSHSTRTRKKIKTTFSSKIVTDFKHIASAQENGIPLLWRDEEWAKEFFEFIKWLVGSPPPEVLEIHPPFRDYCNSFERFLKVFKVFYDEFKRKYPSSVILIENRFGTMLKGGKFLLSKCSDILEFCEILSNSDIELKITLDYPQIFSAIIDEDDKISMDNLEGAVEKIKSFNQDLKEYREVIGGFHLWGKRKNKNGKWNPHAGNLDTFFSSKGELKKDFLKSVFDTFNDEIPRYFVPEVYLGSQSDLHSIITDMENEGFIFISQVYSNNKLKIIKETFDKYWRPWGIVFPIINLESRESGYIKTTGWEIEFHFGKKKNIEYLDCYCAHRMTNNRHYRYYEDGEVEEVTDSIHWGKF